MMRLLRIGASALVAAGLGLGVLQAPAGAQPTPSVLIKLGAKAKLSTDRKTAQVRVTITCKNATPAPITAQVTQNRGSVTVHGTGKSGTSYRCNGRSQPVVVPVKAEAKTRFRTGGANANASVTVSGVSDTDARNIQLT